jgi:HEPN domain-containing protein
MKTSNALLWLKAAYDDLILLNEIIDNEQITNLIAFHAQQTVEKSLKALLEFEDKETPKIHKIQTLIDRIETKFDYDDAMIQVLDELYIEARYPGDMGLLPSGKPSLEDAKEFYNFSVSIFEKVCAIVGVKEEDFY